MRERSEPARSVSDGVPFLTSGDGRGGTGDGNRRKRHPVAYAPGWLDTAPRRSRSGLAWWLVLAASLIALPAAASLWDRDARAMVAGGPPSAERVIFGAWPRHDPAVYRHRLAALAQPATAEDYDDRAVAHERLGQLDLAIADAREAERRWPGRFATAANLGTFLAERGQLEEAAAALEQALKLDPNPPLYREPLELLAVRFALAARADRALPLTSSLFGFDFAAKLGKGFRAVAPIAAPADQAEVNEEHVLQRLGLKPRTEAGLRGLIVAAPTDSADLCFALAELLAATGQRRLAWHAYQRALDLRHPRSADLPWYQYQVIQGLGAKEAADATEPRHYRLRRRALDWVKAFQAYERSLLAKGADPDAPGACDAFDREHPQP